MSVPLETLTNMLTSASNAITRWRHEGNKDMEMACTDGAILSHLHIALVKFQHVEAGIAYLKQSPLRDLLVRLHELETEWRAKMEVDLGSSPRHRTFTHLAWLVDEPHLAEMFISSLRSPGNVKVNGKGAIARFWNEYDCSLEALSRGIPFQPKFDKLSGMQKHWACYPRLIGAITNRCDRSLALEEVRSSFQQRHTDKRLPMNLEDGHPDHPVHWDFREASILRFATFGSNL